MNPYHQYYFLAACINLDHAEAHVREIIHAFGNGEVDPFDFVRFADRHLVLQAVFPRFEKYGILDHIPVELSRHLKEVFELNTGRNEKILDQINELNAALAEEGITPVYMKGTGNMLDNLYQWKGERIFHDIDILVKDADFQMTADILMNKGYRTHTRIRDMELQRPKHFPALFSARFPAYLEIHRIPVKSEYSGMLKPDDIFRDRKIAELGTGCYVMSDKHKMIHNFIHSQLEDQGYIYARTSLRNLYDLYRLSLRSDLVGTFAGTGHYRRIAGTYLRIMYETFGLDKKDIPAEIKDSGLQLLRYRLNLKYRFINTMSNLLVRAYLSYIYTPLKSFYDKDLRQSLIKRLRTGEWYRRHLGSYIKIIKN